ncbi:cyclophilin-like fold protein [Plantactinospora mayteni]|uniref:cyclophilin-like fold protein n=1 Tax=Plantactinospora mayteni TaxID=566021 RepID=UPI001945A8C4|nr:cyclophilin-like fold protein [Plantactinospora mayteni]
MTVLLYAVLAGCSVAAGPGVTGSGSGSPSAAPSTAVGVAVVLRFGDRAAAATLTDTPASRQLTAMLPLTVQLKDVWAQAKSGRLPHPLTVEDAVPVHDPTPGDIYFWSRTEVIAIYYDDLGQAVPDPGLIRLGVVNAGLDSLANAGKRVTVRIDSAAGTSS